MAVLTFNLGVEAGQIAVLLVLLWSREQTWLGDRALHAVSVVVVSVGASLFVARVLGLA